MKEKPSVAQTSRTAFSFEVLPPLKGTGIEALYHDVERLAEFCPKYINITTHRSEYVYRELGNGMFQRSRQRRRPCTVAVAAALMARYGITTVPHLLCSGFTAEELESRCSKYTVLKAGDLETTRKVLADNDLDKYEVLDNGDIRINGEIEDTSKLIAALVGAGVPVYELASVQGTLEQYYLNRTGGNA
jgi:hypothetical protein